MTQANVIIQNKHNHSKREIEKVLIFVLGDGYFYGTRGVISTITRAYIMKRHHDDPYLYSDKNVNNSTLNYMRNNIGLSASSIIKASNGGYVPVSTVGYREYDEKGWFYDYAYQYIIEILNEIDHKGDIVWEITLNGLNPDASFNSITRTVKEWANFDKTCTTIQLMTSIFGSCNYNYDQKSVRKDIAKSIHFNEIDKEILEDIYKNVGCCPCDTCIVRAPCVNIWRINGIVKRRRIMKKCDKKIKYENKNKKYLIKSFGNDNMLKELLGIAAAP